MLPLQQLLNYLIEYNRYRSIVGIMVILFVAYLLSHKRSAVSFLLVLRRLGVLFALSFGVLRTITGNKIINYLVEGVKSLYWSAQAGIDFMFGSLGNSNFAGFIFAFHVLPIVIFLGAFMAILFYFGIAQRLVQGVGFVLSPLLRTTGPETLCAIANSFLGQTDAPLLIRPYLHSMTKSELFVVMVSGMATISGAILVAFVSLGVPAAHLLSSSIMSIPAAILLAKIIYPETEHSAHKEINKVEVEEVGSNIFDAIAKGTLDGLQLTVGVGAMLISFLGVLALINYTLAGVIGTWNTYTGLILPIISLEWILSYIFAPFGYLLGFEGKEIVAAGQLIGTKVALNEAIAYTQLVEMHLSARTTDLITYTLCGFSNFSCIGIQIGGIGALVPSKRAWITELAFYAVIAGTLSNILCAMIANLML